MDAIRTSTLEDVKQVVVVTLGVEDRAEALDASTPLLDSMPELDSMAVVELAVALENRFGITLDDADISGEVFETLGTLAAFVDAHCP